MEEAGCVGLMGCMRVTLKFKQGCLTRTQNNVAVVLRQNVQPNGALVKRGDLVQIDHGKNDARNVQSVVNLCHLVLLFSS